MVEPQKTSGDEEGSHTVAELPRHSNAPLPHFQGLTRYRHLVIKPPLVGVWSWGRWKWLGEYWLWGGRRPGSLAGDPKKAVEKLRQQNSSKFFPPDKMCTRVKGDGKSREEGDSSIMRHAGTQPLKFKSRIKSIFKNQPNLDASTLHNPIPVFFIVYDLHVTLVSLLFALDPLLLTI